MTKSIQDITQRQAAKTCAASTLALCTTIYIPLAASWTLAAIIIKRAAIIVVKCTFQEANGIVVA